MQLALIEQRTYDKLGFDNANPGTVVVRRIRGFINDTYRELMGMKVCRQFRRRTFPIVSTANVSLQPLPQGVTTIFNITDPLNQIQLTLTSRGDIRTSDPGATSQSGIPWAYAPYNELGVVYRQPTGGYPLYAISTAAGDGSSKTAYVEGFDSVGTPMRASHTLNGVTAVQFGSSSAWDTITKFYIQIAATQGLPGLTTAAGTISLCRDALTTYVLGEIPIGAAKPSYPIIQLYPTPASAISYSVDAEVRILDLAEEGDEPLLPEDYHLLLASGAIIAEHSRNKEWDQVKAETIRYAGMRGELVLHATNLPSRNSPMRTPARWSQLGPYFPPGT